MIVLISFHFISALPRLFYQSILSMLCDNVLSKVDRFVQLRKFSTSSVQQILLSLQHNAFYIQTSRGLTVYSLRTFLLLSEVRTFSTGSINPSLGHT